MPDEGGGGGGGGGLLLVVHCWLCFGCTLVVVDDVEEGERSSLFISCLSRNLREGVSSC